MIMFWYRMLFAYLFFVYMLKKILFSSIQRYGMYILPLFCRRDSRTQEKIK
jgi:hypothetical protein